MRHDTIVHSLPASLAHRRAADLQGARRLVREGRQTFATAWSRTTQGIHWVPEHVGNGRLRQLARECARLEHLAATASGARRSRSGCRRSEYPTRWSAWLDRRARARLGVSAITDLHRPMTDDDPPNPDDPTGKRMMRRVAGGARLLVRVGRDAVRAEPLPVREQGSASRRTSPRDFIAEGARPDARLVLHAARAVDRAVRQAGRSRTSSCNGLVLAEDGKKMSKRLKNYPDPGGRLRKPTEPTRCAEHASRRP